MKRRLVSSREMESMVSLDKTELKVDHHDDLPLAK